MLWGTLVKTLWFIDWFLTGLCLYICFMSFSLHHLRFYHILVLLNILLNTVITLSEMWGKNCAAMVSLKGKYTDLQEHKYWDVKIIVVWFEQNSLAEKIFWCLLIYEGETDDCSSNSTKESEKNNTKNFHPRYGNEKKSAPRYHFNCFLFT